MDPSAHESISQSRPASFPSVQKQQMFTKLLSWRGEINDELLACTIYEEIKSGGTRYSMFKKFEGLYGHPAMAYVNHYLSNCEKIEDIVARLSTPKNLNHISNEGTGSYVWHKSITSPQGNDTTLQPLRTKVALRHSQLDDF
ncbi:hypothetical protein BD410DRAFT_582043 [Rickenella mellea]|uniref:Uncharacterized protein n=1 Tax=Rickenella mellea TaxID=50990 RepID=A0A4Y7PFP7_9AGAM|nr:hypothetical protein BD410DRAFT_582043 [Rickenella mellea]